MISQCDDNPWRMTAFTLLHQHWLTYCNITTKYSQGNPWIYFDKGGLEKYLPPSSIQNIQRQIGISIIFLIFIIN